MGKKGKKWSYLGREFDSEEEVQFCKWCMDCQEHGIIKQFRRSSKAILLSPKQTIPVQVTTVSKVKKIVKTKVVDKNLLAKHHYTPDFEIRQGPNWFIVESFFAPTASGNIWVDVKGGFNIHNNHREFSINQKWVYDKFNIFINKIDPDKLFTNTFLPTRVDRLTPKKRTPVKAYRNMKTVVEFIAEMNKSKL